MASELNRLDLMLSRLPMHFLIKVQLSAVQKSYITKVFTSSFYCSLISIDSVHVFTLTSDPFKQLSIKTEVTVYF